MLDVPVAFWMFDGSSGEKFCPQRDALNTSAGALWRPELREVSLDNMGTISAAQHGFSQHSAKEAADALFVSFDADIVEGSKARARLLSCARRPALRLAGHPPTQTSTGA
jgi:hypothetical protein